MSRLSLALLTATSLLCSVAETRAAQEASRPTAVPRMTPLRGDLYRVDFDGQTTVVAVTRAGIILVDPMNGVVASWLKQEFERRFPNAPVRYIVYTHHAFDRASGASVFGKAADIVAHERFDAERKRVASRLPAGIATLDRNQDGALDAKERAGSRREATLASFDRDNNGAVTALELHDRILTPRSVYLSRRTIALGGRTVELMHVPASDAADMTVVSFPAERVVFTAGTVALRSLPASLGPASVNTAAAARMIEALQFDTIVTGDGDEGTKADVAVFRQYLGALNAGVRAGFIEGRTAEEIARTLPLDRFKGLSNVAAQRSTHIRELYGTLRPVVTGVRTVAQLNQVGFTQATCQNLYDTCETSIEKPPLIGTAGMHTSIGRFVFGGELTTGGTMTRRVRASDNSFDPREEVLQHQATVVSGLIGYAVVQKRGFAMTVEAGPAFIFARSRSATFTPDITYIDERRHTMGWTFGASLLPALSPRLAVVIPVRVTTGERGRDEIGRVNVTLGAGFVVNVARTVQ
jgi:glyoxylase-like metal-dependent hydrolase (beta-lactamase superfamily II)